MLPSSDTTYLEMLLSVTEHHKQQLYTVAYDGDSDGTRPADFICRCAIKYEEAAKSFSVIQSLQTRF